MTTPYAISEVSIANQALSRVGSTQSISSFADGSNEAAQCAIWYPAARDALLADFPWPWAKAEAQLAQVAGPETTGTRARVEWSRSYRYPSDCLKVRALYPTSATGSVSYRDEPWRRQATNPSPVSFDIGADAFGRLILTDAYGCGYGLTAIYTQAVADPTQFSPDFADALAWRMAIDLGQALAFSNEKRAAAEQGYERTIRKARATAMNETQSDIPNIAYRSRTVRARWGG
jgi:hypothetical protein